MKLLMTALLFTLSTVSAFASLESQMDGILGDWKKGSDIFRIIRQSDNSIKVYLECKPERYYNSPDRYCLYYAVKIYHYRADLDAFYAPGKSGGYTGYCSESMQVSTYYSQDEMIRVANPYRISGDCSDTGDTQEFKKI